MATTKAMPTSFTDEELPSKFSRRLQAGDVLQIETFGGGGSGTS